ncbi:MAG TPA: class I SAM-dependent methyltransferase [Chloroflexota bacterium]|nr:class I SAM-dependent methyltransferase [Chloroflexota bacterium]
MRAAFLYAAQVTTEPARTWGSAAAAEVWRQGAARRARTLGAVTERMLDAAGVRPGLHVLDVAAGTGDQSVLAAQRIGPTGSLLATDISASMLAAAAETLRAAGLNNVTTQVADASALELEDERFDAAICRFGLMFVPDLHQALVRVRRALKTGGSFAALVWSTEARNPYIGLQIGAVRDMGRMPSPPPTLAMTVSLSAPGTLERAFRDAGFVSSSVSVSPLPVPREFSSVGDALEAMRSTSPVQGELGQAMSEVERAQYWAELERRLQVFVQSDGTCLLPGEALLAVGTK